jgi:hypothetical protein
MKAIKLTKATIKAIAEAINGREVCRSITKVEGAEFEQGKNLIFVDFTIDADFIEDLNVHNEVDYNNIEDLSCWVACNVEVDNITAFDEDGEELEVSQISYNELHQALAVA